ncbi:hypothetical protein [Polaromonas naphthalenivorans]|uniref:General secretion pathway protein C n=1 Tax=Polaromonas naphthalenivorans (strain CJ2) TaxID=365044 RepID=A1VTJ2_POLNA|nr:hypothetical protein [Polaromonas naphthalenivorans]ABM38970.1 hypothetical protein Pnap_3674 [Polaromonas naphthalenivorans CJ2]
MTLSLSALHPPTRAHQWLSRSVAGLLWAVAAASTAYWGSRIASAGATVAVHQAPRQALDTQAPAHQAALARALGASPPAAGAPEAGAAQRFALLGVIASGTGQGAALISVDGEPAQPLAVGARIASAYVLQAVGRRDAVLLDSAAQPARIRLTLPDPDAAPADAQPAATAVRAPAQTADAVAAAPAEPAAVTAVDGPPVAPAPPPRPSTEPAARQDARYASPGR